jgi:hypothetical protein
MINKGLLPVRPLKGCLNSSAKIPYGVTAEHIFEAMRAFTDFLHGIDSGLMEKSIARLEDMLMPANFSSIVGEFVVATIPKYAPTVVKNRYHNGHPDLLPAGKYPGDAAQHAGADGIEVKASRYLSAWQGHNAEDAWLMVFVFDGGRPADVVKHIEPKPFRFLMVSGAMLSKADWKFAGRSDTSRRTITASVTPAGAEKMKKNWIYMCEELKEGNL